ncbi:MAG: ABC transporter substrate-binding protein, partial [Candidatus Thorarchaeota archaeon]
NSTAHIGSGMFKYVSRVPGEYTLLERFDDWWGPDNPNVGQLPNIERVRIDVIRTQEARILAMINGDIDTELYEIYGNFVNTVLNASELQLIAGAPTIWCYNLGMNTTLLGLDDFEVRKAVAYAIDRQELIDIGRQGFGIAATSVIPEVFYPRLYHPDGNFPEQNITIGNQILDAAGWVDTDMNDIRDNGAGVELSFDLLVDSSDYIAPATGTGLKLQLDEIGIEINVVPLVRSVWRERIFLVPRTYEMFISGSYFRPYPIHPWLRMHSGNDFSPGPNPYGWVNNTFDDVLDKFRNATPDELLAASRAVQIAATENMPYIPLYISEDTHALRAEWVNFTKKPGGSFTTMAPETMVFMYNELYRPQASGCDLILLAGVGAGGIVVGVVCTSLVYRRRE